MYFYLKSVATEVILCCVVSYLERSWIDFDQIIFLLEVLARSACLFDTIKKRASALKMEKVCFPKRWSVHISLHDIIINGATA
jgi:hypothetical protein